MEPVYLEGLDDELKETTYQVGLEAMQDRRWQEAIDAFRDLWAMDSGYRDVESKLKEAEMRSRFACILDPLDKMRPHWLSLWQFQGLIVGVGVIIIVVLAMTGVWGVIVSGPGAISTTTVVAVVTTVVPTVQTLPPSPSLTPTVIQLMSPPPEPTATFTSEPSVTPTLEIAPTLSETPTSEPIPTPTSSSTPTPTPKPKPPLTSPLSGKIAFPVYDPKRETYDIYLANVDGSNRRKLVEEASEPAISPDGSKIAFRSWNDSTLGLMVRNMDGTEPRRVSRGLEDACPYWALEKLLVFHSTKEGPAPRLYTAGAWEGANGLNNVQDVGEGTDPVHGQYPAWVPDERIVYKYFEQSGDFLGLYIINSDGSNPTPITDHLGDTMPSVSPHGDKIAFTSKRTGKWEVYVVNIDGSDCKQLTNSGCYNSGLPTWSPDGNHVAFVSDRDNQWAIWAIRYDGSGERKLFDLDGTLEWGERSISWGP